MTYLVNKPNLIVILVIFEMSENINDVKGLV